MHSDRSNGTEKPEESSTTETSENSQVPKSTTNEDPFTDEYEFDFDEDASTTEAFKNVSQEYETVTENEDGTATSKNSQTLSTIGKESTEYDSDERNEKTRNRSNAITSFMIVFMMFIWIY